MIGRTVLIGVASPPILGVVAATVLLVERVQRYFLATSRPLRKLKGAAQSGLFSLFAETSVHEHWNALTGSASTSTAFAPSAPSRPRPS